ncbi:MAG: metallophosphoesterase [Desulfovibrio sp.]|nr:metallophosphoesterase [Desulfovibrio sp.]
MLVVFFCLLLVPPIWLSVRVMQKTAFPLSVRLALVAAFFCISQMFTINHFVFGSLSGPLMPRALLLVQAFCLCAEIFVFVWDVIGVAVKRLGKSSFSPERRRFLDTGMLGCGCALLGAGCGVHNGCALPTITAHTLSLAIPQALDGLRLCFLADLHVGPVTTKDWMLSTKARIRAARPDIICFGGDLSDGQLWYPTDGRTREALFLLFSDLSAPLGLWACTGNHEYYSDYAGWMRCYESVGIRFLHNQAVTLPYKGHRISIVGRDDVQAERMGFATPCMPTVPAADLRILLDHRPVRAKEHVGLCDLQLSGHTHGGQCLGMDRLVASANQGYVRGWYDVSGMPLYVTTGAGLWSGFPVRLGVPAEVALITIQKA